MEHEEKGMSASSGQLERSLSRSSARRKFLLNTAKVGVPAVVVLSSRGAWGGVRDCMSQASLTSVTNMTPSQLSSVETTNCESFTVFGAGWSAGGLVQWPGEVAPAVLLRAARTVGSTGTIKGRWPFPSGVPDSWVGADGKLRKPKRAGSTSPPLTAEASSLSDLFNPDTLRILRLSGRLLIYGTLDDHSSVTGPQRQVITAAVNARLKLDGYQPNFPFLPTELAQIIATFWDLTRVPNGMLRSVGLGGDATGPQFLEAYFDALWTLD